jgi:LytS/YehU family sensor histidine kinase
MVRARDGASGWSSASNFQFTISPPFWDRWWFRLVIIIIASFVIISIFRLRVRNITRDAFMEHQLRESEMKALKAQMNPHFIYNALNSIQALVATGKNDESIHYIGSFSRLLRQVLNHSENNLIRLDEELETIRLFIQLETLRLDMKLKYEKIIPPDMVAEFEKVPPLILQPFVENALWHGLSRKEGEKAFKIEISRKDGWLYFDIKDNGIGREKAETWKNSSVDIHNSKGLNITLKRLIDFNEDSSVSPIVFIDLYDEYNQPAGAQVIIKIKRKFNASLP